MRNPYLIRTAAIATLSAALVGAGWMGMQREDMEGAPAALATPQVEPGFDFPSDYTVQPNPEESEIYEFY